MSRSFLDLLRDLHNGAPHEPRLGQVAFGNAVT
jgi:hypothetical protein